MTRDLEQKFPEKSLEHLERRSLKTKMMQKKVVRTKMMRKKIKVHNLK